MSKRIQAKHEGLITAIDYDRLSVKISYWIVFSFLVIAGLIAVIPILWAFMSGFKELDEFFSSNPTFFPRTFSMNKVSKVLEDMKVGRAFVNSMIIFAGCWFGQIFIGGIAGYTISRLKPKGSKLLFRLMLWTMMMPHTLTMVPMFLTWIDFPIFHINFQNTYFPFWIGAMSDIFNILLFKNFFDKIPNSYIESAKLDGCSNIGIFTKIIVPLSIPIISTVTVFVFNGSWNNFLMPFLLLKDKTLQPVAVRLYALITNWTQPEQMLAAFIVMIPAIIIFVFCSRQILGNNMSAGVKE